ncbi:hypothetical protein DZK26_05745 [Wenzhouxiangella sp. 15190]|nr:hypothetical protein DZK26_05745 [Wenzhouxiangella sp. 15190]
MIAGIFSALVLWGGYCLLLLSGKHVRDMMSPIEIPNQAWWMVSGEGALTGDRFLITRPGNKAQTVAAAALPVSLSAKEFGFLEVIFSQRVNAHSLSLGVDQAENITQPETAPAKWIEEGVARVSGHQLRLGGGKVRHVVVGALGGLGPGVSIKSATVHLARPSFLELQGLLMRSLVDLDGWKQRSINLNRPEWTPLELSPVPVVVAWILLMALLACLWMTYSGKLNPHRALLGIGIASGLGWLLLDLGWQVTLWQRHYGAVLQYGGLSSVEKRLTEVDGDVFSLIEDLKVELDDPERRWVIFADHAFDYFRARYFAVPQPVMIRGDVSVRSLWKMGPGFLAVFVHLSNEIVTEAVQVRSSSASPDVIERPIESLVGQDARLIQHRAGPSGAVLEMKPDQRPWLINSGWFRHPAGLWRLRVPVGTRGQKGWVRLQVFRRHREDTQRKAVTMRELFVQPDRALHDLSVTFSLGEDQEILFRVRERRSRGTIAGTPQLISVASEGELIELRKKGSPWSFLARKVLESEGGVAYEML